MSNILLRQYKFEMIPFFKNDAYNVVCSLIESNVIPIKNAKEIDQIVIEETDFPSSAFDSLYRMGIIGYVETGRDGKSTQVFLPVGTYNFHKGERIPHHAKYLVAHSSMDKDIYHYHTNFYQKINMIGHQYPFYELSVKDLKDKKIFLAYCHKNKEEADQVDNDFRQKFEIVLERDTRRLMLGASIKEFMEKIRKTPHAIVLISDEFLKSKSCMYEILELMKELDFKDRILPILLGDAKYFAPEGRDDYYKYWGEQVQNLKTLLQKHEQTNIIGEIQELRILEEIHSSICSFFQYLNKHKIIRFQDLVKADYWPILKILLEEDKHISPP